MSTQYDGIPSNISGLIPPGFKAIASSTNASPIVVTTTTPHNLLTGDDVFIVLHTVNTAANGDWTVTFIDATSFSLDGSTGNGIGGASGLVQSMAFGVTYPIPSDGDTFDASAFNAAYEALGDRTSYLLEALLWRRNLRYGGISYIQLGAVETFFNGSILEIFGTSRIKKPVKIPDQLGADYTVNAQTANSYQIAPQTSGFNIFLDITSSPAAVDGDWVEFIKPDNSGGAVSLFDEGAGASTVNFVNGYVKMRFNGLTSKWNVVAASTIDFTKMGFTSPF